MSLHPSLDTYVISLVHRQDRRAWITSQAKALGLQLAFFDAVNASGAQSGTFSRFADKGPLGAFGRGDKACTLSHLRAMEQFLSGSKSHGLILEDDARLAPDLADWLADLSWLPDDADLIKLEVFAQSNLTLLLGRQAHSHLGRDIRLLLSRHCGGAGYIVSRSAAERIVSAPGQIAMPIDHLLFNANISRIARSMRIFQISPALVLQDPNAGASEIQPMRAPPPQRLAYYKRELRRGWDEISRLPQQLGAFLMGRAQLIEVSWTGEVDPAVTKTN